MEIIVGKTASFCYGVKRAVEGCIEQANNAKNVKVYCLGEIVHNKNVVDNLKERGINFVDSLEDIQYQHSKVIIRAHGVTKKIYEELEKKGLEVIDYTCPNVKKIHKIAEKYEKEGYYIFLTGTQKHPEVIGTISYCGNNFNIIENECDVENAIKDFKKSKIRKILLISQTTYSTEKFKKITENINNNIENDIEFVVKNTICNATETRQKEIREMANKVDRMIVIGGKKSSNTIKLYEIAKEICEDTLCIEHKDEINFKDIKENEIIGIMAGASTPGESIDEIIEVLKEMY